MQTSARPKPRSRLSVVLRHGGAIAFSSVWLPAMVVLCGVAGRNRRNRIGPAMQRVWGRTLLTIGGVRLEVPPAVQAMLDDRKMRVLLFNHASTLDLVVGAALMPPGGVTVVKRELGRVPLIGQASWAVGNIAVDRANAPSARATMAAAARRMRDETLQVIVAPEGTRAEEGALGPFKLGAFHIAQQAGAPIVPLVFHDCARIWPRHTPAPLPGTVRVRALPELDLSQVPPEGLRAVADRVRQQYMEALAAGPDAADGHPSDRVTGD